jgi:hypothetical protein
MVHFEVAPVGGCCFLASIRWKPKSYVQYISTFFLWKTGGGGCPYWDLFKTNRGVGFFR